MSGALSALACSSAFCSACSCLLQRLPGARRGLLAPLRFARLPLTLLLALLWLALLWLALLRLPLLRPGRGWVAGPAVSGPAVTARIRTPPPMAH
jgi:hypothetical protein